MKDRQREASTIFLVICTMFSAPAFAQQEIEIPRSVAGDKGNYYLMELSRDGNIVTAVSKRVGVGSIGYTRTETNCEIMLMREMGYREESVANIPDNPTKWFELVPGSSKSDLANFVCER